MFDDLREQADSASFLDEEEDALPEVSSLRSRYWLGMSPAQRFIIALMLLLAACILSAFCLLVTEKVVLPFI
ncbi:MAG: hypothetical protein JSV61_05035 [Anaerolineales bacterium]|nr:MAG: hypothetical protein JSV61_05035 [Anaerolineales bacterium]